MKKRLLAFALIVVLLISVLPLSVVAAPGPGNKHGKNDIQLIEIDKPIEEPIEEMTDEELLEEGYVMPEGRDVDFYVEPYSKKTSGRLMEANSLAKYSSVENGRIPAARNQNPYGTCWSFAATAASEASLITNCAAYDKNNTDLSELQLVYFFYNKKVDPLGNATGDETVNTSGDTILDVGGNNIFTTWALASWTNGAAESTLPYTSTYFTKATNKTIEDSLSYSNDIAHLQNARIIPYSTSSGDISNVKDAIVQYGCLATSVGYYSKYYKSGTGCYYNPTSGTNHAVSVVGWNDDIAASNFTVSGNTPAGDGAWLVRNSWGTNWGTDGDSDLANSGQEGYFWVSYYDASLVGTARMYAYDFESADNYKYNYQYDGSNGSDYYSVNSGSSFAATYTVKGLTSNKERIDAVGFGTNSSNLNYSVQIYQNAANPSQPNSGTALLETPVTGNTTYAGYYTVRIPDGPVLAKGDTYSVVIKLTSNSGNSTVTCATDSSYANGDWISFTSNTTNDRTWVSTYGTTFTKLTNETARIKAYTNDTIAKKITDISLTDTPTELEIGKSQQVTAQYNPTDADEMILWSSDNEAVASVNSSGLVTGISEGTAKITATSVSGDASDSFTVKVVYSGVDINIKKGETKSITDDTGYYVSSYTAKYLDSSIATVSVDGKNQQGVSATDPKVTAMSTFKTGNYIIGISGRYIKVSGTTIGNTTDPTQATVFTLGGTANSATLKYNNYYLVHSTSGVSLSTSSSDSAWAFSSGRFTFSTSRKILFWTTTTTYYLIYNNGFTVSTSTSNVANAYTYTAGTPATPEEIYTTISFTGVNAGTTKVLVGNTVYNIIVSSDVVTPVLKTLNVYIKDDVGVELKNSYQISGNIGTSYTVTPEDIKGYITPSKVTGVYAETSKDITLTYTLNTNKSALKTLLDNKVQKGNYTDASYSAYETAYNAGKTVYDKARATQTEVDTAVSNINTAKGNLTLKEYKTLNVNIQDDMGVKLKDSYQIGGYVGNSYTVTPTDIYGYTTPNKVTGTYATNSKDITLVYTLNTNKTTLKNLLDNPVAKGHYTDASYSAYQTALNNGQTVYNKARATQTEVDNAVSAINTAKNNLTLKAQKTINIYYVDDASVTLKTKTQITGYVGDSYTVTPDEIYGYTTPSPVSGTYASDSKDITLKYVLNTNKSALKTLLDNKVQKGNYTDTSYSAYETAYNAGKTVYDKARATQTEVDTAVSNINTAKNNLTVKVAKSINVYIKDDKGVELKSSYQLNGYIGESYSITPETIYGYKTPNKVTGTYAANSADITLVYVLNTNKATLKNLLDNPVAKGNYTDDSYATYQSALTSGQAVYDNARATQTQVDNAVSAINTAKNNLKIKTTSSGYTLDKDAIDSGSEYIIVCSGKALGVSNGSITAKSVSVSNDTIDSIDSSCIWIVTGNTSSGYTLKNKSTGQYLVMKTSGFIFNVSRTLGLSSSSTSWKLSTSGNYKRFYTTSLFSNYYISYSNGFGVSSSSTNLQLFKKNS